MMTDPIFTQTNHSHKLLFIGAAICIAIISNLTFYNYVFEMDWPWAYNILPFGWIGLGMGYMGTFFHELGHTALAWFYGYPTLPMFDFTHGGGLALSTSGQQIFILIAVWAALISGYWHFKDYFFIKWGCAALLGLNLAFAFNDGHEFFINFMGPAAQPLVAGFLLFRALFDLAPRGALERFLNAAIGLAMFGAVFIDGLGLLSRSAHRLSYFQQKGAHGFGDFDKIGYQLPLLGFHGIVYIWLLLALICFIVPLYLYKRSKAAQY
jgi:hypothetical protein